MTVSLAHAVKRALLGRPLATAEEHARRLSKKIALPIFSSDAISSTAYATEEILIVLVLAGAAALHYSVPIAIAVAGLLVIVALSYQQTVRAYPSGGGSYIVGSENLGVGPGLVAAGALLVDYVLTVAVSVASGVAAMTSAFPGLLEHRVLIAVLMVIGLAFANLRGLRESGVLFSVPTYSFVALCGGLVLVGLTRHYVFGGLSPAVVEGSIEAAQGITLFLVLRAFSGGCSAMTGTEAISNGVPLFKPPESRNAAISLGVMAGILAFLLIGITLLARLAHVVPGETETVLSQLGRAVYGGGTPLYFALQAATAAILVVASQASFAGFPQLSSILARDGFLPRQLMNRGDRLVFSNGVIGLALLAIVLLILFDAKVHSMIPLYAVGVFTSFTISQAGMVRHWWKLRDSSAGWLPRAILNGVGAVLTLTVAVVVAVVKFTHGAWMVVVAVPLLVLLFMAIKHHYRDVARALEPVGTQEVEYLRARVTPAKRTTVVLFISQVNELTLRSLHFARSYRADAIKVVTISNDEAAADRLRENWEVLDAGVDLMVKPSPYRELVRPAVAFVRSLEPGPDHTVVVVIPEFVVRHWWEAALHNQNALRLKGALLLVPWVVVVSIPFHLTDSDRDPPGGDAAA